MSKTGGRPIDEKIVKITLDNQEFQRRAQQVVDATKRMGTQMANGVKNIDLSGPINSFTSFRDSILYSENSLSVLGMTAANVLGNITMQMSGLVSSMAQSFTIQPMVDGFFEYELKLDNIQTIMNGTGESLERVNQKLGELNEYSDKTIYSFKDMTDNIGKFTNAGVSLDDATLAIQGIANAAADAGGGAHQASMAMFNFSQALATGKVTAGDWISIEKSMLGTQDFKQTMLDKAVALGTLTQAADGTYQAMEGAAFSAGEFRTSLQSGWFTSDVLIAGLKDYSDTTTEIGKRATEAATEMRTFSAMIDSTKESIGSGWAESFELLFGNLDSATELWTSLGNAIGGVIEKNAESRNAWLQNIRDTGGLKAAWEGLANIVKSVSKWLGAVKEAWRNVFPPKSGEYVSNIAKSFRDLTEGLIMSEEQASSITYMFEGLFSIFKKVKDIVMNVGQAFLNLIPTGASGTVFSFANIVGGLSNMVSNLLDPIVWLSEKLKGLAEIVGNFVNSAFQLLSDLLFDITSAFKDGENALDGFWEAMKKAFGRIGDLFGPLGDQIKEFIGGDIFKLLTTGGMFGGLFWIGKKLLGTKDEIIKPITDISDITGKLKEMLMDPESTGGLDRFTGAFENMQKSITPTKILAIAGAVGILVVSVSTLGKMNVEQITQALISITGILGGLTAAMFAMSFINLGDTSMWKIVGIIMSMALAIKTLAPAVQLFADMDVDTIGKSLLGFGSSLAVLVAGFWGLSKAVGGEKSGLSMTTVLSILGMTAAIKLLSSEVEVFASLDIDSIVRGVGTLGSIFIMLGLFVKQIEKTDVKGKMGDVLKLTIGIRILANAVKSLSGIPWASLLKSVTAMGAVIAGLVVAMKFIKNPLDSGKIITFSIGINIMVSAVKRLADVPWYELLKGVSALTAIVAGITLATKFMNKNKDIGKNFMFMSIGLMALSKPIEKIGKLSWGEVIKGIGGLSAMIFILSAAGKTMGQNKLELKIIGLSFALNLLVIPIKVLGSMDMYSLAKGIGSVALILGGMAALGNVLAASAPGLLVFSAGLGAISLAVTLAAAALTLAGVAISAFAATLTPTIAAIGLALGTLVLAIIGITPLLGTALKTLISTAVSVVVKGAVTIAEGLETLVLGVGEALINLLVGTLDLLITTIGEKVPELVVKIVDALGNVIVSVAAAIPNFAFHLVEAGINLINGFADGIRQNQEAVFAAVRNVVAAVLELVVTAVENIVVILFGWIPGVSDGAAKLGDAARKGIQEWFNVGTTSAIANDGTSGFVNSIASRENAARAAGRDVANGGESGLNTFDGGPSAVGGMNKFKNAIRNGKSGAAAEARSVSSTTAAKLKEVDAYSSGTAMVNGFASGLRDNGSRQGVWGAVTSLGQWALDGLKSILNINSPSKATESLGGFTSTGFSRGIENGKRNVLTSARNMGQTAVDAVQNAVKNLADITDFDATLQPVIKPILDMTGIGTVNMDGTIAPKAGMGYYSGEAPQIRDITVEGITVQIETRDTQQAQETMAEFSAKVVTVLKDELRKVKKV